MPGEYLFKASTVVVEETGELAIGATGQLIPTEGGEPVQVYDLNSSPIASVLVGPKGAHQAFRADIPPGILDFGSVQLVAVSVQALFAAIAVEEVAEQAVADVQTALAEVQTIREQIGSAKGVLAVPAGQDPPADTPDGTIIFEV